MLDGIFQFPDVSRPGVIQEQAQGFGTDPMDVFALCRGKEFQEMLDEQRNIIFPLP
jgi:hypothetical protein